MQLLRIRLEGLGSDGVELGAGGVVRVGVGGTVAVVVAVAVGAAARWKGGDSSLGGAGAQPFSAGAMCSASRQRPACAARAHRRAAAGGRWNALNASRRDDQRSLRRTLFHACCAISQTVNRSSRSMPSSRTMRPNFWPAEVCWSRARRMSRFDASLEPGGGNLTARGLGGEVLHGHLLSQSQRRRLPRADVWERLCPSSPTTRRGPGRGRERSRRDQTITGSRDGQG